jgi:hypothetical protein
MENEWVEKLSIQESLARYAFPVISFARSGIRWRFLL